MSTPTQTPLAGAGAGIRLLPVGQAAILVEVDDADLRRRLHRALLDSPAPGTVELVPAARTVLVQCAGPEQVAAAVAHIRRLVAVGLPEAVSRLTEVTRLEVRYDGADLEQVADIVGLSPREVVERHTGQLWRVEFAGFMPGFGYLSGETGGLEVPRLTSPRTRIPAGSVALAGEFTGLYPQASPGGWQLIGTTDAVLWDPRRRPPALLVPGATIEFVSVPR